MTSKTTTKNILTLEEAGWKMIGQCPEGCHVGYMSPRGQVCEIPTEYVDRIYISIDIQEMPLGRPN